MPQLRWVKIERTGTPDTRLYPIVPALIKALTDPLTEEEKYVGTYVPPKPERYIFEGTYDEAIEFFNATEHVESADAEISIYTDGNLRSVRATATRCRMPPENPPIFSSARLPRPTSSGER